MLVYIEHTANMQLDKLSRFGFRVTTGVSAAAQALRTLKPDREPQQQPQIRAKSIKNDHF